MLDAKPDCAHEQGAGGHVHYQQSTRHASLAQPPMPVMEVSARMPAQNLPAMLAAAENLIECYQELATDAHHLLQGLLHGELPGQWTHYPEDDVIDRSSGYQYFYHSHAPEDRENSAEHGHFHLFARLDGEAHAIDAAAEQAFLHGIQGDAASGNTANLLCISLDARGVPTSLFTVNRWVTGDQFLSGPATLALLRGFTLQTEEHQLVNRWLKALVQLFWPQIETLMHQRDQALLHLIAEGKAQPLFDNPMVEVLSECTIDIDQQIGLLNAALEAQQ